MTFPKNAATTWTRPPGRPSQQETLTGRRGRASEAKLGRRRGAPWGASGKGRWREGLGRLRNGGWRGRKSNRRWCRGGRRGRGACWHHRPSTNAAAPGTATVAAAAAPGHREEPGPGAECFPRTVSSTIPASHGGGRESGRTGTDAE